MIKYCPECGNELTGNTGVCDKCGKVFDKSKNVSNNNKKKSFPVWAIVLIVIFCVIIFPIIIFIVLAVIGYNYIESSGVDIKDYIDEVITSKGTIGDTLSSDGISITLTDALIFDKIEGEDVSDVPSEGKEYLVFFFNIMNNSSEDKYVSVHNFTGYVDDVFVSDVVLVNDVQGSSSLGADLAPGKKTTGYVAFEISTSWEDFEIRYKSNSFDLKDSIIFDVVKEEDNNGDTIGDL